MLNGYLDVQFEICFQRLLVYNPVIQQGRVEIKDLSPEIFGEMLEYIYTGRSPNLERLANSLLSAADKVIIRHHISHVF